MENQYDFGLSIFNKSRKNHRIPKPKPTLKPIYRCTKIVRIPSQCKDLLDYFLMYNFDIQNRHVPYGETIYLAVSYLWALNFLEEYPEHLQIFKNKIAEAEQKIKEDETKNKTKETDNSQTNNN